MVFSIKTKISQLKKTQTKQTNLRMNKCIIPFHSWKRGSFEETTSTFWQQVLSLGGKHNRQLLKKTQHQNISKPFHLLL